MAVFRRALTRASEDYLLVGLLVVLGPLLAWSPHSIGELVGLVPWQTIVALASLMLLSAGLEASSALARAGGWLFRRVATERLLALVLVVFSALLAAIVTNDVALFVTVPLTVRLVTHDGALLGRLVIFQAFAVTAGSALTPVGNPQNLLLWQSSQTAFAEFTLAMLPLAAGLLTLVMLLVPLAFSARRLPDQDSPPRASVDCPLAAVSLLGYPVFLFFVEAGMAPFALGIVVAVYALTRRNVFRGVDWTLLVVFVLMFLTLGVLADLALIANAARFMGQLPGGWLTSGTLISQVISNVPAAILLDRLTDDWRAIAWGVNVGGFGLAIGSMANLIALRLARRPRLWMEFHAWSVPLLALSWIGAFALAAIAIDSP
ncbi:SLC13 family permease [Thiohalorhabdus sp.]|uniref:SLC13 family permease n=1 Tax=Thiohalorhabdus sp. TaxID=3094134 RepID=UPI002FC28316